MYDEIISSRYMLYHILKLILPGNHRTKPIHGLGHNNIIPNINEDADTLIESSQIPLSIPGITQVILL